MRSGRADDLNRERRNRRFTLAIGVLLAAPALVVAQTRNHSFDILAASATVCADGAVFDGQTTAGSAVGIQLTSEVYDVAGTTLLLTGDAHTFTAVGETYTFTVLGALNVGDTVRLSVTESPGTIFSVEGNELAATVANCSLDICGDGNVDPGETCDVADPAAPPGCRPAGDPEQCTSCGDGNQEASEDCDDGNTVDGDGCSAMCVIEPFCGDGNVDPGEACDDGNTTDGDGCSAMCVIEAFCGDGNVDPGEGCDDGNTTDGDGCSAMCAIEPFCGDGNVDAGETCDDGNTVSGDGCSAMCMTEVPTLGQWGAIALGLALLAAALLAGGGVARGRSARSTNAS